MINLILNRLKSKRILIAGYGREGKSTLKFLQKYLPQAIIGITDRNKNSLSGLNPNQYVLYSGNDYLKCLSDYDIIIKTPGISLKDIDIQNAVISSQTDLFLEAFHNQVIGITGTKGKSTTSSLIYHLLKNSGRETLFAGNIGLPVFEIIEQITDKSIIVFELSVHQLEFIHRSPHVGVLLNIFQEHLDHFGTLQRYRDAKLNIIRFMDEHDTAIILPEYCSEAEKYSVQNVLFPNLNLEITTEKLPLQGQHNLLNIKAAFCACQSYGISIEELIPHLFTFHPLEHRQELVGTFHGITFYNDSISTIPQATIAAIETLPNISFLLLGGLDRGIDYTPLIDYLIQHPVANILYTGDAGTRIIKGLKERNYNKPTNFFKNLEEAFEYIKLYGKKGDNCLLSPAAASYDQYKNFEERGQKFKNLAAQF